MEELQISLDQHRGAYLPGQTISGHVHALFNETIKARQVRVDIIGIARTSWTKWETYYTGYFKELKTNSTSFFATAKALVFAPLTTASRLTTSKHDLSYGEASSWKRVNTGLSSHLICQINCHHHLNQDMDTSATL